MSGPALLKLLVPKRTLLDKSVAKFKFYSSQTAMLLNVSVTRIDIIEGFQVP